MEVHHIGYLVKNIDKSVQEFIKLGYVIASETVYDTYRDVNICFLKWGGAALVELVMPVTEKSVVSGMLKKMGTSGATPYHICYCVDDVARCSAFLRENGYIPMGETMPAPALNNSPAAFYYNRYVGIVELISQKCPRFR